MSQKSLIAPIKVLLVEDYEDFSRIIKYTFSLEKDPYFQIDTAPSLQTAIEILQETPFDLILLDLGLPDSKGVETFDTVLALNKNIPVVILTGTADEDLALSLVKRGAQDYIVKTDLAGKMLVRIVKYALERHQQKEQVGILNHQLEKLSSLDPLTELLNRRGLQNALVRELEIFSREASSLMVILLDLDNFKPINDAFGHAVGDIVLQEIAKSLRNSVRTTDYISRVGGDEFLVLLPNTRPAEAEHLCERIRLAINRNPVVLADGKTIRATASFGMIEVTKRMPSIDELLQETHGALAKSKRLGKNRVSFGHDESKKENNVIEMLKRGTHFHSVKQSIVDLQDDTAVAYEFLSRSNIPGYEMPDEFFNFSRESNILSVVDRHCLESSILASYAVPAGCEKHINLLPSTIADFQSTHFNRLFPPQTIGGTYCIEISEQQILGDPSYLVPKIKELRERNIRFAIDDVGFGRSCLESLIVLHPDIIKIDKKVIQGVSSDKSRKELLRRLLSAIGNLDAKIIAEGIEDRNDAETLRELGVRYGQGFLWGQPA